jgi:uncharacterized membrane protein
MDLARFWRHVLMSPLKARRAFGPQTLDAIARQIAAFEQQHRGEVVFVVEAELTTADLWRDLSSRDRAREVFASQGVWNTAQNNGVLVYLLLADRKVEIVADRGVRATDAQWQAICRTMEEHFRAGRYQEGAIAGVREVSTMLAREFPPDGRQRNELPDRPVVM